MSKFNQIQNSFLAGELSPKGLGRTDLSIMQQGCEEVLNKIIYPQGGAARRPGSQYLQNSFPTDLAPTGTYPFFEPDLYQDFDSSSRVFPFIISKTEFYIITMTAGEFVHIHNPITGADSLLATPLNGLSVDTTTKMNRWGALTTAAAIEEIQYAQIGDTMFFVCPNRPPMYIKREKSYVVTDPLYALTLNTFWDDPKYNFRGAPTDTLAKYWPFRDRNIETGFTITPSATTGNAITLTASQDLFNTGHIGAPFKITNAGSTATGVVVITAVASATSATAKVLKTLGDTTATSLWEEAAWSNYRGWPRTIAFFEGRAVYGGNASQPDTLWGSQQFDVLELMQRNYAGSTAYSTNDKPFTFTISAGEANQIQWMSAEKTLVIGTLGREYIAKGPDETQSLGPLNVGFVPQTAHGSEYVQPVRAQNSLLFISRSGQKVREFIFNLNEDAYTSDDMTFYADHLLKKAVADHATFSAPRYKYIAHQESDNQITWFVDNNGGLSGLTRDRKLGIAAWHYHKMGGNLGGETPKVTSIAVLPSLDGTHDDLYMMVGRTINGNTKYHLERIGKEFQLESVYNSSTLIADKLVYSDSAKLVRLGSPGVTFTGFGDFIGQSLSIIADGSYIGEKTVNGSGNIVLDSNATEIIAGINYTSRIKLVNPQAGSAIGSSQNTMKRVVRVLIRFYRSIGARFGNGTASANLEEISMRDPSLALSTPTPLYTGDKELTFQGEYARAPVVVVEQNKPLPCNVTCVVMEGVGYD